MSGSSCLIFSANPSNPSTTSLFFSTTRSPQPSPKNRNLATPNRIFHVITLTVFWAPTSTMVLARYITAFSISSNWLTIGSHEEKIIPKMKINLNGVSCLIIGDINPTIYLSLRKYINTALSP